MACSNGVVCMLCLVELVELLLQIIVEESSSTSGLEEDTATWVRTCTHTH